MTTLVENRQHERAVAAHVIPFVAWVLLMKLPGLPPAWNYALRALVGAGILCALRPWRWYGDPRVRSLPAALLVGVAVYVLWVLPETRLFGDRFPALQEFYLRYGVRLWPFGHMPEPAGASPFAPAACGWALTAVRMLGSGLVIAVIEEFFWRGFLYRLIVNRDFFNVPLGRLHWPALLISSAAFGLEHDRWLAGLLAGLLYGLLMIRTRSLLTPVAAHAATNLLLALHVVLTGNYGFW